MNSKYTNIKNLTRHDVNVVVDNKIINLQPEEEAARIIYEDYAQGRVCGVPVTFYKQKYIKGLPAPKDNTALIVSQMIAMLHPDRDDLFYPGDLIRNRSTQKVIGCMGLKHIKVHKTQEEN